MYQILKTFDYAHSKGIINRDVKLLNLGIETSKRKVTIIDWGNAEFYHPYEEYWLNTTPKARKSPEEILDYS